MTDDVEAGELEGDDAPDALDAEDELEGGVIEPPAPSVAPGPRRLQVPEGEIVRRVDRFVADRTGLATVPRSKRR